LLSAVGDKVGRRLMMRSGLALVAAGLLLAACGESRGDRALSGAGIGAATGAAGSAVTGGNILGGAVLGGAAGGAVGAVTDEDDLDLGEPVWK
jgi:osmotically inducible lipoprotein OsmB